MYHYRNKKTGMVIKTHNQIAAENWELAEDADSQMDNEDTFKEDIFEDEIPEDTTGEEEPEQTEVAGEVPAEKPKTSPRGKK